MTVSHDTELGREGWKWGLEDQTDTIQRNDKSQFQRQNFLPREPELSVILLEETGGTGTTQGHAWENQSSGQQGYGTVQLSTDKKFRLPSFEITCICYIDVHAESTFILF